jgi:hypothetical protein
VNKTQPENEKTAFDSMCVDSESISNKIDEIVICKLKNILNREFEPNEEL